MKHFDVQGHRGCRGLYPENTIPAFLHAIDLGVNTLEFDAVISKDKEVIISHEPFMSHWICLDNEGKTIEESEEMNHNLYQLSYEEIKSYDCGVKEDSRYPGRKNISVFKPSLKDVVIAVNNKLEELNKDYVYYNIEIKRKCHET